MFTLQFPFLSREIESGVAFMARGRISRHGGKNKEEGGGLQEGAEKLFQKAITVRQIGGAIVQFKEYIAVALDPCAIPRHNTGAGLRVGE